MSADVTVGANAATVVDMSQLQEQLEFLERSFTHSALNAAGILDAKLIRMVRHMEDTGSVGVLFTSRPVSAALTKWPLRAFLFLTSIAVLMTASILALNSGRMYKVGPLISLNATTDAPTWSSFGLMKRGCPITPSNQTLQGAAILGQVDGVFDVDGVFFEVGSGPLSQVPSTLRLFTHAENGEAIDVFRDVGPICTSGKAVEQGQRIEIDWGSVLAQRAQIYIPLLFASSASWFVACVLAIRQHLTLAKVFMALGINFAAVAFFFVSGFGRCHSNSNGGCDLPVIGVAVMHPIISICIIYESWLLPCFVVLGAFLVSLARCAYVSFDPNPLFFVIGMQGILFMLFPIASWLRRRWLLDHARRLVQNDRVAYEGAFEDLLQSPSATEELTAINTLTKHLQDRCSYDTARQLNRKAFSSDWGIAFESDSSPGSSLNGTLTSQLVAGPLSDAVSSSNHVMLDLGRTISAPEQTDCFCSCIPSFCRGEASLQDFGKPVTSLDQLYVQAQGLSPILKRKVQTWASHSNGGFPLRDGGLAWARPGDVPGNVKWAKLKSPKRAIEKAVRSYDGGDVSRLLDICRQQIIFRNLADLRMCLEKVKQDSEVSVVRVKNRLSDEGSSQGYRDIALNVRVVSDSTCRLGVEGHVCEVQLLMHSFYALKSDEGHKRYVTYRNLRAE